MRAWLAVAVLALAPAMATAQDAPESLGEAIDLTSFREIQDLDDLIEPVGLIRGDDGTGRRFYVAPIIGASWGQFLVDDSLVSSPDLFTAGGAAGIAFSRPNGQWRLEFEARYRDSFRQSEGLVDIGASDNWSTLVNLWRDVAITRNAGVYGGAGIGGGGYRFRYAADDSEFVDGDRDVFAWQAGGGVIYAVSDRVTLDLGYRFYGTDIARGCDCGDPAGALRNQFLANELLFAVRIYEPFRGLRR